MNEASYFRRSYIEFTVRFLPILRRSDSVLWSATEERICALPPPQLPLLPSPPPSPSLIHPSIKKKRARRIRALHSRSVSAEDDKEGSAVSFVIDFQVRIRADNRSLVELSSCRRRASRALASASPSLSTRANRPLLLLPFPALLN